MTDYDSPWKTTIEFFFEEFLAFFYPQAHTDIDWSKGYGFLDKELDQAFWQQLTTFEQENKTPYISSVERIGIKKGNEQGIVQGVVKGEAKILRQLLLKRFGPLPDWVNEKISKADTSQLEFWSLQVLDASDLEAVFTGHEE